MSNPDPPLVPAGGYDATLLDTSKIAPGRTYWVAHAIQQPDGTLLSHGKRLPKLFDDPAYCPRLIETLAKQRGVQPVDVGRPVVVALVRVIQPNETAGADSQLPTTTGDLNVPKPTRRFLVVRPGTRMDSDGYRFAIEHGDFSQRYDKSDTATQIDRCELPADFTGSIAEAREWWTKNRKPAVVKEVAGGV